jgi:hypothetical protein
MTPTEIHVGLRGMLFCSKDPDHTHRLGQRYLYLPWDYYYDSPMPFKVCLSTQRDAIVLLCHKNTTVSWEFFRRRRRLRPLLPHQRQLQPPPLC